MALNAHRAVFNETLPVEQHAYDYALLALDRGEPCGYATVKEFSLEEAYLQHGGSFGPWRGNFNVGHVYMDMLAWLKERYQRISTRVENTNIPYLKLALTAGFRVIGTRTFRGMIFLELLLERA